MRNKIHSAASNQGYRPSDGQTGSASHIQIRRRRTIMDRTRVCNFDLHAILDGEAPPERLGGVLPRAPAEPDSAEKLADLEEQRQALLALRRALDEIVPPRPPSDAEIEIGQ